MPDYRRNRVPGGTYFFSVNLAKRRSDLLVREVETLRASIRVVRLATPFHIDAWVILPDHMHCIWTLPLEDTDYSGRWRQYSTFHKCVALGFYDAAWASPDHITSPSVTGERP